MALSYTFDSDVEGWTEVIYAAGATVFSWDASHGSPDNGCLKLAMPDGGGFENENNQGRLIVSFSEQETQNTDPVTFKYRINNTGVSRTFTVTLDLKNTSTVMFSDNVTPVVTGDSGWLTFSSTVDDAYTLDNLTLDVNSNDGVNDDIGDYIFYVDTFGLTAVSGFGYSHSTTGIPGSIKVA